jgi:hypothetical protein
MNAGLLSPSESVDGSVDDTSSEASVMTEKDLRKIEKAQLRREKKAAGRLARGQSGGANAAATNVGGNTGGGGAKNAQLTIRSREQASDKDAATAAAAPSHAVVDASPNLLDFTLRAPNLQADQWKIYPCSTTPWTVIEKWHKEGSYRPYAEVDGGQVLLKLICDVKARMFPWIRLNRIVRDIPNNHIIGGNDNTNMRQLIQKHMRETKRRCMCMRCREVGLNSRAHLTLRAELFLRRYNAHGGTEYFLSYETPDQKTLFAFCRLRISDSAGGGSSFECLKGAGLVRELHVYGQLVPTYLGSGVGGENMAVSTQHEGFGRRLMAKAEEISWRHGKRRVAVIAGVGTREYYRKQLGYHLEDLFLLKDAPEWARAAQATGVYGKGYDGHPKTPRWLPLPWWAATGVAVAAGAASVVGAAIAVSRLLRSDGDGGK